MLVNHRARDLVFCLRLVRSWRLGALVADRMIECRSGDSCTIIGCRKYHHCASSYRGRRGHGGRSDQRESGRSRE